MNPSLVSIPSKVAPEEARGETIPNPNRMRGLTAAGADSQLNPGAFHCRAAGSLSRTCG